MNRKIKFRGKQTARVLNYEWVYGSLVQAADDRPFIMSPLEKDRNQWCSCQVFPDTVGQFTGLHDKNGKEIYEGDILTADHYPFKRDGKMNYLAVVEWFDEDACWYASLQLHKDSEASGISVDCPAEFNKDDAETYKVIGNIHDNIDLLKNYEI